MAASQDWINKDFYKALGVSKDATDAEIRKAYNAYARKYHPDRNPGDKKAEEKFKAAAEAYQVLSNEQDRKQYDALRQMAGGGPRFSSGPGGTGFEDIFSMFTGGNGGNVHFQSSSGGNFDDFLSMFGGHGSAPRSGFGFHRQPEKGADVTAHVSIPLRKAVTGTTVAINSNGKKVTAKIPAGVTSGQKVRLAGKGRPGVNGGAPGDVYVTITVEPHPVYELKGSDVYVNVPVTFDEAALGAKITVPTLYGESVKVKVPAGSSTDKVMRVRGKGLRAAKTGDLYVRLKVAVPKKLSHEAREAVRAFRDATEEADPRREFNELARL